MKDTTLESAHYHFHRNHSCTIPSLFTQGTSQALPFGTSSLLIAVSVILETKRQLDDLLVSRNYDKIS